MRNIAEPPRLRLPLIRGLQALDRLRDRPSTATELAQSLGVNRSTAHRLLRDLEHAAYVTRGSVTKRYRLAPDKFSLSGPGSLISEASDAAYDTNWGEASYQALREIRDLIGESTMFVVPARDRMLYVAFFGTDHPIGVQEAIGSARPMHASAVGKAYLSALPPATLDVVLGRLDYSEGTESSQGPFHLRDMLDEVRRQGYASDRDETFVGLSCVATAVIVNGSTLVGAAGITGLTHRFSAERVRYFSTLLVGRLQHLVTK